MLYQNNISLVLLLFVSCPGFAKQEKDESDDITSTKESHINRYSELSSEKHFLTNNHFEEQKVHLRLLSEFWHPESFNGSFSAVAIISSEGKLVRVVLNKLPLSDEEKKIVAAIERITFPKGRSFRVFQIDAKSAKFCHDFYLEHFAKNESIK